MKNNGFTEYPWLQEVADEVRRELKRLREIRPWKPDALEIEREDLLKKRQGWALSLGDPTLPQSVRVALQNDWATGEARLREIESLMQEATSHSSQEDYVLDPNDVLTRLRALPSLLGDHEPTVANMALSMIIERIDCGPNGEVVMRMCKLGLMPGAVDLLAERELVGETHTAGGNRQLTEPDTGRKGSPRRRSRLSVASSDDGDPSELRASLDFVASTQRFAGLDDRWFEIITLQVPAKGYWIDQRHEDVKRRYSEIERETGSKPTLAQLAREFDISEPMIRQALDLVVTEGRRTATDRRRRGGYTPAITVEQKAEIVRQYDVEGISEKEIAKSLKVSRGSVAKALNEWDEQRGEKRPDGRRRRWELKSEE